MSMFSSYSFICWLSFASSERPIYRPPTNNNGIERTLHWPSADPVPIQKEIQLLMSNTLIRRGEFGKVYGSRALDVELSCIDAGLTFHQGAYNNY